MKGRKKPVNVNFSESHMSHSPIITNMFSKSKITICTVFSGLLMSVAGVASATVISDNSSIGANTYVSTSNSENGKFDIAGQLGGRQVVSATVTANFVDDLDLPAYNVSTSGWKLMDSDRYGYLCSKWGCLDYRTDNYYSRTVTSNYIDPLETATLTIGGEVKSVSSNAFSETTNKGSAFAGFSWNGDGWNYYTNQYVDHAYGNKGAFTMTFALNTTALSDLNADGLLSFLVKASSGDFRIGGITLNATLGEAGGQGQGQVPEPGSIALLGLGALALGLSNRKRRSVKQRV